MAANVEIWTTARDFRLRLMRLEGDGWEEIAKALAVPREAAMARADRIGAAQSRNGQTMHDDPARDPLPAGHPRSWSVLTQGTWLTGTRYPTASKDAV